MKTYDATKKAPAAATAAAATRARGVGGAAAVPSAPSHLRRALYEVASLWAAAKSFIAGTALSSGKEASLYAQKRSPAKPLSAEHERSWAAD